MNCVTIIFLSVGAQLALSQSCAKDGGCADPALASGSRLEEVDAEDSTGLIQSVHAMERMESPTAEQRSESKDKHWFVSFIERGAGGYPPSDDGGGVQGVQGGAPQVLKPFYDLMKHLMKRNEKQMNNVLQAVITLTKGMNRTEVVEKVQKSINATCDQECLDKVGTCLFDDTSGLDKCVTDRQSSMPPCKHLNNDDASCLAYRVNGRCINHPEICTSSDPGYCSMRTLRHLPKLFNLEKKKGKARTKWCKNFASCLNDACGVGLFGIYNEVMNNLHQLILQALMTKALEGTSNFSPEEGAKNQRTLQYSDT